MRSLYGLSGLFLSKVETLKQEKAWTGFTQMFDDLAQILALAAPVIGGAVVVYCLLRKASADEQDQKMWRDKIKITIISTIGAVVAASLFKFVLSYFLVI